MSKRYAYLALLLTVTFWGASFVATKIALRELSPATIVFTRFAFGLIFLFSLLAVQKNLEPVTRRELGSLVVLGFLGITFHQWLQATGLQTASATVTSWIIATIPVFVALLGYLFLGESLKLSRIAGIVIAALGVLIVVSDGNLSALVAGSKGSLGDVLIAISSLNWAVFTVLSKRFLGNPGGAESQSVHNSGGSVAFMLHVVLAGWVFTIPWVLVDGGWRALATLSLEGWIAVSFLGVVCSGLAYFLWYEALARVDAVQAGAFLYFEPIVTTALAVPLLGEAFTFTAGLGGAAILFGVWLVNR
ncbi:MAG: EamA family transporter [Anaerolineales bacterium]|nr:EamA family transporter [Anaerolineales bacterium]